MIDPTPLSNSNQANESGRVQGNTNHSIVDQADQASRQSNRGQLWMHRISVFLFVLISAVAGVLLIILPWTPEWTDNTLLLSYPGLRVVVSSGFCRGVCSGLGLLDIWIGFWEALHYHEHY